VVIATPRLLKRI